MLTAKQEKFVQCLIKGMSQREAYKTAYPKSKNWKDESIDCEASKLFANTKVLQRYQDLQEKAEDKAIMSAIERKKWLTKVINGEIYDKEAVIIDDTVVVKDIETNVNTKIKALDTLNKMDGEYIEKLKVGTDDDKPFEVNIKVIK